MRTESPNNNVSLCRHFTSITSKSTRESVFLLGEMYQPQRNGRILRTGFRHSLSWRKRRIEGAFLFLTGLPCVFTQRIPVEHRVCARQCASSTAMKCVCYRCVLHFCCRSPYLLPGWFMTSSSSSSSLLSF